MLFWRKFEHSQQKSQEKVSEGWPLNRRCLWTFPIFCSLQPFCREHTVISFWSSDVFLAFKVWFPLGEQVRLRVCTLFSLKYFKRKYVRKYSKEISAPLHHFDDCIICISWYSFPGYITIYNLNNIKYLSLFSKKSITKNWKRANKKKKIILVSWFFADLFKSSLISYILRFFNYRNVCLLFYKL